MSVLSIIGYLSLVYNRLYLSQVNRLARGYATLLLFDEENKNKNVYCYSFIITILALMITGGRSTILPDHCSSEVSRPLSGKRIII